MAEYTNPEIEIIEFSAEDVVVTSGNNLPIDPSGSLGN